MTTIERIRSLASRDRHRFPRKFGNRPGGSYVTLTEQARRVIDELARETNATPDEVLRRSVTLYKMVLDDRKRAAQASTPQPIS